MAEHQTQEPQRLHEFTQNLIADLASGAITAQEALTASWQYSFLREELATNEEAFRDALLVGGEAFKESLVRALTELQKRLADLPNFGSQLPDVPKNEQEIRDKAALRAFAIDRIEKASQASTSGVARQRREFVHSLVTKYSSTVPTIADARVESALIAASQKNSPQAFAETLVSSVSGTQDMKNDILQILAQDKELLPALSAQSKHDAAIYTALLEHLDTDRPDVLVDVVLSAPPTESIEQSILRATKLAGVADAIQDSAGRRGGKLQFFSSGGGKGVAGGLKKGADGILSLVGEPVREMILAEKVNGTLRDMLKGSQKLVDRLGENFVRSAFFTHVTQDLTKQLGEKTAVKGQARTVFDDLISSIIRGPLDPSLTNTTEGRVLDYYELMRANANAPKGKAFIPPGYALWDLFRLREEKRAAAGYKPRGWFPSLSLGTLGGWLGNLFSGFVDKTTSFLFTNPRLPGQLASSRRAAALPIPIGEDMPLLLSLVVIGILVLLFILPTNFNLSLLSHSSKASALLAALQKKGEGFHDDSREFPVPDFGPIKQSPNACIQYGNGTSAPDGRKSYQLNSSQQEKMNAALKTYPQIGLFACILGCPANTINFTAFNASSPDGFWAWAPSAQPGNIFLYDGAFSASSTRSLARLIAHELAHQIQYFQPNIFNSYLAKGYCGPLGTYDWTETSFETFAEAAGMYMIGDPLLKQKCEEGYEFMENLFSQCR